MSILKRIFTKFRRTARASVCGVIVAGCVIAIDLRAASEIVVAIRYLQSEGTSHSHLYLYRDDGKFLRQLTSENSGQDVDPVFAPDGETIAFTREKEGAPLEFWIAHPLGGPAGKLEAAPDWYEKSKTSPYFTNRDSNPADLAPSPSASPAGAGMIGERKTCKA